MWLTCPKCGDSGAYSQKGGTGWCPACNHEWVTSTEGQRSQDAQAPPTPDPISIQVAKLSPKPGDVLVVRKPPNDQSYATRFGIEAAKKIADNTGCFVIIVPDGMTLDMLDEAAMNAAGWYRRDNVQPDLNITTTPDERTTP